MKFIKSYSKYSVDEYINSVKNNLDKVEEIRKDLIPTYVPENIIDVVLKLFIWKVNWLHYLNYEAIPSSSSTFN